MGTRPRLPSPAMAVACVALCFGIGGGSYLAVAHDAAPAAKKKPKGKRGPRGPAGPAGPAGATNVVVRTVTLNVSANGNNGADVFCQPGERAVSGGGNFTVGSTNDDRLGPIAPLTGTPGSGAIATNGQTPTGINTNVHNGDGVERPAQIWVICAKP